MKLFQQIRRIDYLLRHLYNLYPYLTLAKMANLILNYTEYVLRVTRPRSLPPYIKIEPTPLCHLRCPGCWHSREDYKGQLHPDMKMSLQDLTRAVEPLAHCLLGVSLSNRGEPLLHREIALLIRHLHDLGIAVSFPTNLSLRLDAQAVDDLVASGVDSLLVSLDGASAETYGKYRVGGKFELVKDNVKKLQAAKRRLGLRRPRLVWKFVIFEHNRHETEIVRCTYRDLGFDAYEMVPDNKSAASQAARRKVRQSAVCFWPWHTMMVDWNGQVAPCCTLSDFNLGNAIETDAATLWRSDAYAELRKGLAVMAPTHPTCQRCLGIARDVKVTDAVEATA